MVCGPSAVVARANQREIAIPSSPRSRRTRASSSSAWRAWGYPGRNVLRRLHRQTAGSAGACIARECRACKDKRGGIDGLEVSHALVDYITALKGDTRVDQSLHAKRPLLDVGVVEVRAHPRLAPGARIRAARN